jgi:hypothetical protein
MEKFEFVGHMQAFCRAFNNITKETEAIMEEANCGQSFTHDLVRTRISIGRTNIAIMEVPRYFIHETRLDVLPDPALVAATAYDYLHDEKYIRKRGLMIVPKMLYPTFLIRK